MEPQIEVNVVNSGRPRIKRLPEDWRALIDAQPSSGLGVKDYCRQHRLTSSCFYRWRRFLAGDSTASSPWVGAKQRRDSSPNGFAAVRVAPEGRAPSALPSTPASGEPIRLRLAHGRELLIPLSIPVGRLAELLAALESGKLRRTDFGELRRTEGES